jgi:hypothetical protein
MRFFSLTILSAVAALGYALPGVVHTRGMSHLSLALCVMIAFLTHEQMSPLMN